MADPVYDGIDVITVTIALVLAAALVFLLAQIVPDLERDTLGLGLRSTGEDARR